MRELKEYDPKKTAFLVLKTALDTFPQKHCTYTSMSYSVGKVIEFELRLKHLLKTNEKKGSGIILGAKKERRLLSLGTYNYQ